MLQEVIDLVEKSTVFENAKVLNVYLFGSRVYGTYGFYWKVMYKVVRLPIATMILLWL